jgi:hypothetical protein
VREVANQASSSEPLRFTKDALLALQEACETFVVSGGGGVC